MSKENIIITRKYTLIPAFSDRKEWLTKVMDYTKHIRTSYKNAGPLRLGAGRRCGLLAAASAVGGWAAACLSGCRRGNDGEGLRRGDGLPGMAGRRWSGGDLRRQFVGI